MSPQAYPGELERMLWSLRRQALLRRRSAWGDQPTDQALAARLTDELAQADEVLAELVGQRNEDRAESHRVLVLEPSPASAERTRQ